MSNYQRGFSFLIILIIIGTIGIGGTYYVKTKKEAVTPTPTPVEEKFSKPASNTFQKDQFSTSNDLKGGTTTVQTSDEWTWSLYGCGSSSACSYEVVNSDRTIRYICNGKYDKSTSTGEKTPIKNEDPQTTLNFNCSLLSH